MPDDATRAQDDARGGGKEKAAGRYRPEPAPGQPGRGAWPCRPSMPTFRAGSAQPERCPVLCRAIGGGLKEARPGGFRGLALPAGFQGAGDTVFVTL